jgi:hypothetical protein
MSGVGEHLRDDGAAGLGVSGQLDLYDHQSTGRFDGQQNTRCGNTRLIPSPLERVRVRTLRARRGLPIRHFRESGNPPAGGCRAQWRVPVVPLAFSRTWYESCRRRTRRRREVFSKLESRSKCKPALPYTTVSLLSVSQPQCDGYQRYTAYQGQGDQQVPLETA